MTTGNPLKQGIAAVKAGRKAEARKLLTQVIEQDERNEMAWLWLSGAVDADEDRRICLENVLAINPNNEMAKRGLASLTAKEGARLLSTVSSPASDAESSKDKHATQPVVETKKDISPEPGSGGRKPVPHAKAKRKKASPSWTWLLLGSGGTAVLLLLGFLLAYTLGFIQLPSRTFATPTPLSTPTLTPEQAYARAMEPALRQLGTWLNGPIADWDKLMASDGEVDYAFQLDVCLNYPAICWDDTWRELQKTVTPVAIAIAEGGFEVKSSFGAATPPPSISVAHEQIVACVEHKTEFANAIVDFLTRSITPSIESQSDPCNLLPSAIDQVTKFVQHNQ